MTRESMKEQRLRMLLTLLWQLQLQMKMHSLLSFCVYNKGRERRRNRVDLIVQPQISFQARTKKPWHKHWTIFCDKQPPREGAHHCIMT